MIWACERFQEYLTGLSLHIETDHKPLVPLLSTKSLGKIPLRLQWFILHHTRYQCTHSHIPGEDLCTTDMLSRASTDVTDTQAGKL